MLLNIVQVLPVIRPMIRIRDCLDCLVRTDSSCYFACRACLNRQSQEHLRIQGAKRWGRFLESQERYSD